MRSPRPQKGPVTDRGLEPGRYLTLICRPILENSILELVQGFSRSDRGVRLAILGHCDRNDEYHRWVLNAAGDEVVPFRRGVEYFPG